MEPSLWNPFRDAGPANAIKDVSSSATAALPPPQSLWNQSRSGNAATAARGAALWASGQQQNQPSPSQHHHFNQTEYNSHGARPPHGYAPHDGRQFRFNYGSHSRGSSNNNPGYGSRGRGQSFRGGRGGASHFQSQKLGNGNQQQRIQPAFYCEVCECDFRTQAQLDEHIAKHIKCPRCDFVGVFDTIEEHFEMIHLTSETKPPETAEDLAKWKQERAAKYPRVKPVVSTAKIANEPLMPKPSTAGSDGDSRELSDGEIEDEEAPARPSVKSLTSLLSCYESESDGEPEELSTKPLSYENKVVHPAAAAVDTSSESHDILRPEFAVDTEFLSDYLISARPSTTSTQQPRISERVCRPSPSSFHKTVQPYFRQARRKPKTLYEKLVAKDLEKDNDHLLQCFAHLYKNNFLNVKPAPPP